MRIALLQDHLRNGGTENQTLHIAHGLARAGHDTNVVVFREGGHLDSKARTMAFRLHFIKQGPLKTDWFAPGLHSILSELKSEVAIAMGRMANCLLGLPHRSAVPYKTVATLRTGKSIPWLYRRALKKADYVVANSHESLKRVRADYGIERADAAVIYNGCIRKFDSRHASSTTNHPIRLLNASMFRREKKQRRLLEICKGLPGSAPWHLTLAGEGPERERCMEAAARLGISERVSFPGLISDPEPLFLESDLAVHASAKESLPNFLVEAQMAGLPVVAYDVGGVSETFVPNQSGYLIPHGDESAFISQLQLLIESPDLRQRMSQAAREYALETFSPEAQLNSYLELLENAAVPD